ncbi:AtzE family amidohydrolase, partial [Bordetella avium]
MSSLLDIAGQIRSGQRSAADVLEDCLARVRADSSNAFTAITEARARREAASIDARRASGEPLP